MSGTASCLYEGAIRHRRFDTRRREFRHPLALAYIDLDELPGLLGGRLVRRSPGPVRFRRRDYFGDSRQPLAQAVADEVERQRGVRPDGPVRVLTQLRWFGHCFNPVSFYHCFARDGRLEHVLAEVTNTPWGERQAYVVSGSAGEATRGTPLTGQSDKQLHVSPFLDMEQRYHWRVSPPGRRLEIHIENRAGERLLFDATLGLRRRELTPRGLAAVGVRYPLASLGVLALIYGHAVGLKLGGVPVRPHPRRLPA